MRDKMLLTLDVGTTAVKAGLFSEELQPLDFNVKEYNLLTPAKGMVEIEPEIYWCSAAECIKHVVESSGVEKKQIISLTCTTQGETIIPVGYNGEVLHNAVVWLDSRAEKEAEYISQRFSAEDFYHKTGCPEISPIWPVSKILWFKNNKKNIYDNTFKFLLLEDYLIYKLTGKFVTNPAVSCSTGYFDIYHGRLWNEILDYCDIAADKIPECKSCGTLVGNISEEASTELELPQTVAVSTGAMDQVASAVGSGNITNGTVTETTGTAQVVAATCDKPELDSWSPVTVYAHAVAGKFLLINVSQTAGIILKWFRDEFCKDIVDRTGDEAFIKMSELAEHAPPLSKGLSLFPHFTGMQVPKLDSGTRGVFFGIGLDTGRECFIRAIMEGVGYMLRESMEVLETLGIVPSYIYSLGGGAKSSAWNQIKSDICKLPVTTMKNEESASIGAAILGGIACGVFTNVEEAVCLLEEKNKVMPNTENSDCYEDGYSVYRQMYERFKDLF